MAGNDWEIDESGASFIASYEKIGEYDAAEGLATIALGLRRRPEGFSLVPGFSKTRVAKTRLIIRDGGVVPALTLWFRCDEELHKVVLLFVEISDPDDMLT